jgi:hypothetical protein
VRVLRDERAVPHIYAENLEDLAFTQGYVHAQERLWQMDLTRRAARGQLSEIVGQATLEMDKENRILGLGVAADRAAERLDDETRRYLEAYARGVNAYIEQHPGSPLTAGLPVEFAMLRYRPSPEACRHFGHRSQHVQAAHQPLAASWRGPRSARRGRSWPRLYVARSDNDHPSPSRSQRRGGSARRGVLLLRRRHSLEEFWRHQHAGRGRNRSQ